MHWYHLFTWRIECRLVYYFSCFLSSYAGSLLPLHVIDEIYTLRLKSFRNCKQTLKLLALIFYIKNPNHHVANQNHNRRESYKIHGYVFETKTGQKFACFCVGTMKPKNVLALLLSKQSKLKTRHWHKGFQQYFYEWIDTNIVRCNTRLECSTFLNFKLFF